MMTKKKLNRIAKLLDALNPLSQAGFEDKVKMNALAYGNDPNELDPDMADDLIRANIWATSKSPYGELVGKAGKDPLLAEETIFAAGLQCAKGGATPDFQYTAECAAKAANFYGESVYHEVGIQGKFAYLRKGILGAIEDAAKARDDGEKMIAHAKLWGLCVYAAGQVGKNWTLYGDDNC